MLNNYPTTALLDNMGTQFIDTGDFYSFFSPKNKKRYLTSDQFGFLRANNYKLDVVNKISDVMDAKQKEFTNDKDLLTWVRNNIQMIMLVKLK